MKTKHPGMVLLHGGSQKGAELIASKWADARKVPQVAFKPDWIKHTKAAPFRRNDAMLETMPIGVLAFPGNGINENLADKARKLGIPVQKFTEKPALKRRLPHSRIPIAPSPARVPMLACRATGEQRSARAARGGLHDGSLSGFGFSAAGPPRSPSSMRACRKVFAFTPR